MKLEVQPLKPKESPNGSAISELKGLSDANIDHRAAVLDQVYGPDGSYYGGEGAALLRAVQGFWHRLRRSRK